MHLNGANTGFMLIAAALVMLMTPGLAFFYGGLVGRSNTLTIMIQSFASMGITTVMWWPRRLLPLLQRWQGRDLRELPLSRSCATSASTRCTSRRTSRSPVLIVIPDDVRDHHAGADHRRDLPRTASRSRRTSSSSSSGSSPSTTRSSTCSGATDCSSSGGQSMRVGRSTVRSVRRTCARAPGSSRHSFQRLRRKASARATVAPKGCSPSSARWRRQLPGSGRRGRLG